MGKENTRTLKNTSYKKPSKKKSKNNNTTISDEMREILDSASEQYNPSVKNFLGGNMGMPQMSMPQMSMPQMGMPQMGMPQMGMPIQGMDMPMQGMGMPQMPQMPMGNQMQMFSPANYDPIMLQSIAPLQTFKAMSPPSGLMDPTSFAHSIASYSRQSGGNGYGIPKSNLFRII
jgi:hypothetical protein